MTARGSTNEMYLVTGGYRTESGDLGTFRFVIAATSPSAAVSIAVSRLRQDKRRRYAGKLDASAALMRQERAQ